MEYKHLLLTRFNLQIHMKDANLNEEWLDHRFALFDRFCYPSVLHQSCQNFDWLMFFDSKTSQKYRERIKGYKKIVSIFVSRIKEVHNAIIDYILSNNLKFLITSRLDNDDAIHRCFIEKIQQTFDEQEFMFINFNNGCQWHNGKLQENIHKRNPFISLIERCDVKEVYTVWCCKHKNIYKKGKVKMIETEGPMWMMAIHERNVSNRIKITREVNINIKDQFGVK